MQALCGLQGIFDLFNCKTPDYSTRDSGMQQNQKLRFSNEIRG